LARAVRRAAITATKLTDRGRRFLGQWRKCRIVIGPDGLVMIEEAIRPEPPILPKPSPRSVPHGAGAVNTHYHFDHTGSNEYLGKNRVRIVAHENVKKRLSTTSRIPQWAAPWKHCSRSVSRPRHTLQAESWTFGPEAIEYTHAAGCTH